MAIFSRRTIQRLITENNSVFNMPVREQIRLLNLKNEGNTFNDKFLSREWEIVVLNAFAKYFKPYGKIIHEKKFNRKALDIYFESSENPELNFVADICSVSDSGRDREFPIEELEKRFVKFVFEKGLRANAFGIYVFGNDWQITRDQGGLVLYIPKVEEFDNKIFNQSFHDFLDEVELNPHKSRRFLVNRWDF